MLEWLAGHCTASAWHGFSTRAEQAARVEKRAKKKAPAGAASPDTCRTHKSGCNRSTAPARCVDENCRYSDQSVQADRHLAAGTQPCEGRAGIAPPAGAREGDRGV